MLTKFMEGVGTKLADVWIASLLTPACIFWVGGLLAWVYVHGWQALQSRFLAQPVAAQIAIVVGALVGISVSAVVVQRCNLLVINLLEGYWPGWMRKPRRWLIKRKAEEVAAMEERYQVLARKDAATLTTEEYLEYAALDQKLMSIPVSQKDLMPTELGNILHAAELRPQEKYGLHAHICWPRLWLLLSPEVKKELTTARAMLNIWGSVWLWGVLFLVWIIWAWWAVPFGLLTAFFAYRWMIDAAHVYAELLDATFDLYRVDLYKLLRWPLPTNPFMERQSGQQISNYLWRGSDAHQPTFKKEEK